MILLKEEDYKAEYFGGTTTFLIRYYYDKRSFYVKCWYKIIYFNGDVEYSADNQKYVNFVDEEDYLIELCLRFSGDCVHNIQHPLDHFCDINQMKTFFELYEYISTQIPWEDHEDDLISYIKKTYNYDITQEELDSYN